MHNLYSSNRKRSYRKNNGEKKYILILKFNDSARFMTRSLANLVNNLFEGIHRTKCKVGYDDKKCEPCRIKYRYCDCFLEYTSFKDNLVEYKRLCCNKNYQHKFDEKSKEQFFNKYKFVNYDNKKFILLLWKSVYPYEYMDDWENFNETLPVKENFYSHLNMEEITNANYAHTKRVGKDFEIKHFGGYHDLYIQSNTLMLADVFENFRNICLKIYELDPAKFLSAPGLA